MNKWMRTTVAGLASLALCAVFGTVLLVYAKPFSDQTYSLAMTWETEAMPDGWVYDQKGWTATGASPAWSPQERPSISPAPWRRR